MTLTPEQKARLDIDAALEAAGWILQNRDATNLAAGPGVAVREARMASGHGFADYLLFVNGKAVGAIEAKPAGLNPPLLPLPFVYMSTGVETRFINGLDPDPKSRTISANLPHIHRPETLAEWIAAETLDAWMKRLHAEGAACPQSVRTAHRRDGGHGGHGHGHPPDRDRDVHAGGEEPAAVRADEGARHALHSRTRSMPCSSSTPSPKAGADTPCTKTLWVYDLRTNKHFTLKTRRLTRADLDDFVACYNPGDRHSRQATWSEASPDGRWRPYSYEEILTRDKLSLDFFWLRDESLEDSANLPEPHVLAQEIADDLRSALAQIEDVLGDLELRVGGDELEEA